MDKSNSKKIRMSLRYFITISIIVVSLFTVCVFAHVSTKLFYENQISELMSNMEEQCEHLVYNMGRSGEITTDSMSKMKSDAETVAAFFGGKVMIVDENYLVTVDTSGENNGTYIINADVIRVMTGEESSFTYKTNTFIQYIYPVADKDGIHGVIMLRVSLAKQNSIRQDSIRSNTFVAVIALIASIFFAYLIGYLSTRGLKFINKHIEEARDGHVNEKIPEKGFEEFRIMTENYNKTIAKLVKIDSSRQEFVSNVSHELKTPITSMKVLADSLIQNEEADLTMYKEFMTDIVAEIDRESQIITDLLTLVKTDKNTSKLEIKETDINELIEIIIKRVTPIAASRGIEIYYGSYKSVMAYVDDVKLSLALSNIIENAVKYNIDNGWVKVTLNADHKNFHVKVADSGVGIPDDCKDQVFERFYRVDKARSRDTGGTGLGLSITRNIIRMHKGNIKLYSESGAGTTFTIKIPINRPEKVEKVDKVEKTDKRERHLINKKLQKNADKNPDKKKREGKINRTEILTQQGITANLTSAMKEVKSNEKNDKK